MTKRRSATLERSGAAKQPREAQGVVPVPPTVEVHAWTRVADSVVEASWLVAALAAPLYFSAATSTGFEPDKAVLVRVLAIVAGGAWLAGVAVRGARVAWQKVRLVERRVDPLLIAGLVVFAAFALATVFSVDRRLSLYGSQSRGEGLVTYLAYGIFFAAIATSLRHRFQLERLITVLVFGSVPAVIYGFVQQFGLDPLPTGGDPSVLLWPSRSTFGQHVFFGTYLVLVTPLTLARVLQNWSRRSTPPVRGVGDEAPFGALAAAFVSISFFLFLFIGYRHTQVFGLFPGVLAAYALLGLIFEELPETIGVRRLRTWGYGFLLLLQIVTLGVVGARGAWFGFFASVPVFAFLLAWWMRRPRIWWSVLGVSGAVALFVFVLNIPGGPLQPLRTVHGLTRIANLTESGEAVSSTKGRMQIWSAVGTLMTRDPAIGGQWGGPARDVIGYGPDTMHIDFESIFPLKLRRTTFEVWTWDRSHNIFLDYLVQAGLLGLLGLLAALALFVRAVLLALRTADQHIAWPIMGLGAAVGGHLADGIFGIEMPASLLLFWLFIGIGAALPAMMRREDERAEPGSIRSAQEVEQPADRMRGVRPVLIVCGVLIVLYAVVAPVGAISDHPAFLAALWLFSALLGVGAVAHVLVPRVVVAATRRARPGREVRAPALQGRRKVVLGGIMLGAILALGSQFQFERAAMNERIGSNMLQAQQMQPALSDLQATVRVEPVEPYYYHDLGTAYVALAQLKYASADPAFRPTPGDVASISPDVAITLGRDQLYQLGVYALEKASSLDPLDPLYQDAVGGAYLQWRHPQQALAAFQRAESVSYENPKYLAEEARALLQMHQASRALAVSQQAIAFDPSYWYAHASAALSYHQMGNRALTRSEAFQALFWEPVFWPPPPAAQVTQMKKLQKTG